MLAPHPLYQKCLEASKRVGNCLCIGLDPDLEKLPQNIAQTPEGVYEFLLEIIEETQENCIAYKPNISFFEGLGIEGLRCLEKLMKRIPKQSITIIDGKRGDIGNTSKQQAKFIYDYFGADATTVNPYMGYDSIEPFIAYKDKLNFLLALTSNSGSKDIQMAPLANGSYIYEHVIHCAKTWNAKYNNIGLVIGATQNEIIENCRKKAENMLFLIPGIGAQGGTYKNAHALGKTSEGLSIINASRSILYPKPNQTRQEAIQNLIEN